MNEKEILEGFLAFENNSSILDYHFQYRNMLMWPFVRVHLLNAIIKSNISIDAGYIDNAAQKRGTDKIFSYKWLQLFKVWKNPFFCRKHKDIIFFRSVLGNVKDDTGKYYDRIHDYFIALYNNTAIIEEAPFFKHFYPTKHKIYEADFLDIICILNEKIARLKQEDSIKIDAFMHYLKTELPFKVEEEHWRTIKIILERYAKNNKVIYQYYKKCFIHMQPKLVFVKTGCYGYEAACKLKVLNDLGIPSAEIQHGLVSLSHFAYNFADAIYESKEYLEYMPDVFLTMGQYWMKRVRLPIAMEVLGNANFDRNKGRMKEQAGNEILILPSEDTQAWMDLVEFVSDNLPDRIITVKIHPSYRKQFEVFKEKNKEQSNVNVSIAGNIYDYLMRASMVIGDNSTVLYEAAALDKMVMIWNNAYSVHVDSELGCWFDDKYELAKLIETLSPNEYRSAIAPNDIFADNIKENYLNFIQKYL